MNKAPPVVNGFRTILKQKEAELVGVLRRRDDIAIERSADQMDEIQYASERDLAIRNADRESNLRHEVVGALRRIEDGSYGTCIDCEEPISPKRLAALAWAVRCVRCQEVADRDHRATGEFLDESPTRAA